MVEEDDAAAEEHKSPSCFVQESTVDSLEYTNQNEIYCNEYFNEAEGKDFVFLKGLFAKFNNTVETGECNYQTTIK